MKTFLIFIRDSLQLILAPSNGWEDVAYDDLETRPLLLKAFIPWLVILSLSSLTVRFFNPEQTWLITCHTMIVMFLKYFITYFLAGFAMTIYMPVLTKNADRERLNNIFLIFSLGLLALIDLIANLIPIDLAVLNFFPLYVLYIMWKGARFLKVVPAHSGGFVILSLFAVIVPPYLLKMLFSIILPY